jgi:hypothetical protein
VKMNNLKRPNIVALLCILVATGVWAQHVDIQSPISKGNTGRTKGRNSRIITTGIRSPELPSNHALIITVSHSAIGELPGVLKDRVLATDLAHRIGVPTEHINSLSENEVTRDGFRAAFARLSQEVMKGDRVYVYFSGYGARTLSKVTGQCTESIVMQDSSTISRDELTELVGQFGAKADKTLLMIDSAHFAGSARLPDKNLGSPAQRSKFSAEATSHACNLPASSARFGNIRGIQVENTDSNLVVLTASRSNESAWDTDQGGALTSNFSECVKGAASDENRSGSISMQELTDCVQGRLNSNDDDRAPQHIELTGNGAWTPGFSERILPPPTPMPNPPAPEDLNTRGALTDIFNQRDDRWSVEARLTKTTLHINKDLFEVQITSQREGFVYIFYRGSGPDSFYLIFPNEKDSDNAIQAEASLVVPRASWSVQAVGPPGVDDILVMVSETPRDFSNFSLPAKYILNEGPYKKIKPTSESLSALNQIATLSEMVKQAECAKMGGRDLAIASRCSSVFGAAMVAITEEN